MKKFFKVLGIIVVVIFIALLIIPFFFQGKIETIVKEEINKQINATVDFRKTNLSLLRNFPDFTLSLKELSIIGKDDFEGVTLLNLQSLRVQLDVIKVLKGEYVIKEIKLVEPEINVFVLENGKSNYDIMLESDTPDTDIEEVVEETNESSPLQIALKRFIISNANISYNDKSLGIATSLNDLNIFLKGSLSTDQSEITTELTVGDMILSYDNISYLNHVNLNFDALFLVDLKNSIYSFKKNKLMLNDLALEFEGSVGMAQEDITILLDFKAPDNQFKSILSLIPTIYAADFEQIKTDGKFTLEGFVKGTYNETKIPAYGLTMLVDNASFSYGDLPTKAESININANVNCQTGETDDVKVDIQKFSFSMANNPFELKLKLAQPISDPDFDIKANGKIDFAKLSNILMFEEESMAGKMDANFALKGKLSDITNEQFQKISASGSLLLDNFAYNGFAKNMALSVPSAQVNFSPVYVDLINTKIVIGESNFALSGKVNDYLSYFLSDGTLKGNLTLNSSFVNINQLLDTFMTEDSDSTQIAQAETSESVPADTTSTSIELPKNIDFVFDAKIDSMHYDNFRLYDVMTQLKYNNQTLTLNPLQANLLDGSVVMNGDVNGQNPDNMGVALNFNINKFNIQKAYESIGMLKQIAPIAKRTQGDFSTSFNMTGNLDGELSPVYESLNGGGTLTSSQIKIEGGTTLEKLATLLGNEDYKRLVTDGLNLSFEFLNGKIYLKPFDMTIADSKATFAGNVGFDQTIDYHMAVAVPYAKLGSTVKEGVDKLNSSLSGIGINLGNETEINIKVKMTGELTNPSISLDYGDISGDIKSGIQDKIQQEIDQQKEALSQKAKETANKLISEAQAKGDELIKQAQKAAADLKSEAQKLANKAIKEADTQAEKLIAEGKKKGAIAEAVAVKAAQKLKDEAKSQANNIVAEAESKGQQLITKARQESNKLIEEAKKQAEKL